MSNYYLCSTRQKLGLEDHKKRLAVGTKMALNVLDDMFPRRRGVETIQVEGRETVVSTLSVVVVHFCIMN